MAGRNLFAEGGDTATPTEQPSGNGRDLIALSQQERASTEARNQQAAAEQLMNAQRQAEAELRVAKADRGVVSTTDMINGTAPRKKTLDEEVIQLKQSVDAAVGNRPTGRYADLATQYTSGSPDQAASSEQFAGSTNALPDIPFESPTRNQERASQYEGETSTAGAVVDNFAQGLSLGTSDEIEAGLSAAGETAVSNVFGDGSVEFGEQYDTNLENVRNRMAANTKESPSVAATSNLVGSITPAARIGSAVANAPRIASAGTGTRIAAQAGAGAAEGAVIGAGYSEADVQDDTARFGSDVLAGAGWGSIFGAGGEAAATGLQSVRSYLNQTNGKQLIQDVLEDRRPEGMSDGEYSRLLSDQIEGLTYQIDPSDVAGIQRQIDTGEMQGEIRRNANGSYAYSEATLADLDELSDISQQIGRVNAPAANVVSDLELRSGRAQLEAMDALSRPLSEGETLLGEPIRQSDLLPDTNTLNPEAFNRRIRQEANTRATPFYDAADSAVPTSDQRDTINFMRSEYPAFDRYWKQGRRNTRDSDSNRNSYLKSLDEATKAIDADIGKLNEVAAANRDNAQITRLSGIRNRFTELRENFATPVRAGDLGDADTLARIGVDADEMVNPITTARQIGTAPRQIANNVNRGMNAITGNREARTTAQTRAFDDPDGVGEQQGIGAGVVLRDIVEQRSSSRDSVTGELLSQTEKDNYNRLVTGTTDAPDDSLNILLDADRRAKRTANIANTTPSTLFENLRTNFKAVAQDAGAMAAMAAFISQPNTIMAGLVSTRAGQSATSRMTNKALAREAQKDLLKMGASKKDITDILAGNFEAIPRNKMVSIGNKLAAKLGITGSNADDTLRALGGVMGQETSADASLQQADLRPVLQR
ncbi:hypothetical protein VCRA2110O318_40057 [Vibrio crassostreae]|nr:hypothetical protein VCRA2117O328_40056 [Vibrio crassostreae]CAK2335366.1 hypothetical protein VCRA2110O318_40057 [Vibrio crassostreae]CAK2503809.1 hypothetical protein VCRA2110O319_50057 [Vibrio crassostreae]CAK2909901.1 hypothetical protein VCRA217O317_30236 [Vibrio crassostreae]